MSVTIRETGRYVEPLLRDLSKPSKWFRPVPGIGYQRAVDKITKGMPLLLLFPTPFHPIEVLMADRGWGGRHGSYDLKSISRIDETRQHHKNLIVEAGRVLYWPEPVAYLFFHAFVPCDVFYDQVGEPYVVRLRKRLAETIGVPPPSQPFFNGNPARLWGELVKGEVEI